MTVFFIGILIKTSFPELKTKSADALSHFDRGVLPLTLILSR